MAITVCGSISRSNPRQLFYQGMLHLIVLAQDYQKIYNLRGRLGIVQYVSLCPSVTLTADFQRPTLILVPMPRKQIRELGKTNYSSYILGSDNNLFAIQLSHISPLSHQALEQILIFTVFSGSFLIDSISMKQANMNKLFMDI